MKSKANDHSKYRDWIDPDEVKPYERNAKKHDDKQVRNIANSIKRFGWQQDTVITSDNVLVIGHGRRLAAIKLGCMMPYHRIDKAADDLTDEDIRELRIADNQTNAETGFDFEMMGLEIDGLELRGLSLSLPGQTKNRISGAMTAISKSKQNRSRRKGKPALARSAGLHLKHYDAVWNPVSREQDKNRAEHYLNSSKGEAFY